MSGPQDWNTTQAQATNTLGPLFGWSLDYDPAIKTTGTAPPTPAVRGEIKAVHNGSVDVQFPDGTMKTYQVPTWSQPDDKDSHGNQIFHIDTKKVKVQDELDGQGHAHQLFVVQDAQPGGPATENASKIMQEYAQEAQSSDPSQQAKFKALQQSLEDAGLLTKGKYIPGLPDDATQQALQSALVMAARTGETLDEVLAAAKQTATTQKPVHLTNPADVAANAQKASYKVTGRPLDPGSLAAIQANAETTAQQTFSNSGDVNIGSFTPSEAWLEQQVQQIAPQAAQNYSAFQNFQAAQSLFGSSSSPIGNLYHG